MSWQQVRADNEVYLIINHFSCNNTTILRVIANIKSNQNWWSKYSITGFRQLISSEPTGSCENQSVHKPENRKQHQTTAAKTSSPYTIQYHTKYKTIKNTKHDYKQCASHRHTMTCQRTDLWSIFCSSTIATAFFFYCSVLSRHLFYSCFFLRRLRSSFFQSGTRNWAECSVWRVVIWSTRSAKSHTLHIIPESKCYQKSKLYLHLQNQC